MGHHTSEQIERVRAYLRSGELRIGDRLPGERSLASSLGLCRGTLRCVLDAFESEGVLVRRPQSGTYLASVPVASGRGALIALIAPLSAAGASPGASEQYWIHQVVSAFERTASPAGARILLLDQSPRLADPCSVIELVREAAAAGARAVVLLHAAGSRAKLAHAQAVVHDCGMQPVMVSSRSYPGLASQVYFDSGWGAHLATRRLITAGHARIGFCGPSQGHEWVRDRLNGYQGAMEASGLDVSPDWILASSGGEDVEEAFDPSAAVAGWLSQPRRTRPTAFVAANDRAALQFLQTAREAGLACPADFSVVGFDNQPEALVAGLTTVERPVASLGEAVARVTLERLNAEDACDAVTVRLRPVLIDRGSVAAPPADTPDQYDSLPSTNREPRKPKETLP